MPCWWDGERIQQFSLFFLFSFFFLFVSVSILICFHAFGRHSVLLHMLDENNAIENHCGWAIALPQQCWIGNLSSSFLVFDHHFSISWIREFWIHCAVALPSELFIALAKKKRAHKWPYGFDRLSLSVNEWKECVCVRICCDQDASNVKQFTKHRHKEFSVD